MLRLGFLLGVFRWSGGKRLLVSDGVRHIDVLFVTVFVVAGFLCHESLLFS